MQKSVLEERKKLIPLRRLAKPGLYSSAYLSQLVQRKKLKAEKIGRNYYTTKEWFREYLDLHAQDDKRLAYKQINQEKEIKQTEQPAVQALGLKKNKLIDLIYRAIAISAIVFVFVNILFSYFNKKVITGDIKTGQVAGVEEKAVEVGTSTLEIRN